MLRRSEFALMFGLSAKPPPPVFATNLPDDLCISYFGFVPNPVIEGKWKQTLTWNAKTDEADIRYALVIFLS
jgi:hypothetical protein